MRCRCGVVRPRPRGRPTRTMPHRGAVWSRSPRRRSFVSAADRWHPWPGTAPRPARRSPVACSCRRRRGATWRRRPVGQRHRVSGDPTCPDQRAPVRRSPRTPASRTRRRSPGPALPGFVGSARRTPASRCPRSFARPARRSPAGPARRLPGAPAPRTAPNLARPRPPPAAGPVSAGSSGVEESRRGVLRCSCTPRFPHVRAVRSCAGPRRSRRQERQPSGHAYPHGRAGIPARRRRGANSPACVRVTLRVVPGRTGTSPPGRGHLPGTSPYPAVILSGSLRS